MNNCPECYGNEFLAHRQHAQTCSITCRGIEWRKKKRSELVRLEFTESQYSDLQTIADYNEISVRTLLMNMTKEMVEKHNWLFEV